MQLFWNYLIQFYLIQLSGIGHAQHLQEMGLPVISDLPVGDNMHVNKNHHYF